MKVTDIRVHREPVAAPSAFDVPCSWERHDDPDGGECVAILFSGGGRVLVHTNKPLLFVEPDRH
jgi:hypothetical protein